MKLLVTSSLIVLSALSALPAFSQEIYLRDVPEGHYAYEAVYDLIERGVTGGFPDGTFQGKKMMDRFGLAAFLSKLARSFGKKSGADEKLVAELKTELSLLRHETAQAEKRNQITGALQTSWQADQVGYRFRGRLAKEFSQNSKFSLNFDTMDAGGGGPDRDPVREMIDVAGMVELRGFSLYAAAGPGEISRAGTAIFPLDNGMFYRRPWRTLALATGQGGTEYYLEFISRAATAAGSVGLAEVSGKVARNFGGLRLAASPRFFLGGGDRDLRLDLAAAFQPFNFLAGFSKTSAWPHGLYLRGEVGFGNTLKLLAQKVGSQFREKFSYNLFDLFDRNVADGAAAYGLELESPPLGGAWLARLRGAWNDPGGALALETRLGFRPADGSLLELIYQLSRAGTTDQAVGLAANFTF